MTLIIEMASGLRCDDTQHEREATGQAAVPSRSEPLLEAPALQVMEVMETPAHGVMPASLRSMDIAAFLDRMD